ncbi:MAG: sigma-70 family RNA polymerase sigma factor [bacterium]
MNSNVNLLRPIRSIGQIFEKNSSSTSSSSKIDDITFANLMQEHKVYLYKIAYSYVKNEQASLDIIQETTYKGLINIASLDDKAYFKTWITRVLINTCIDYLKKNKKIVLLGDEVLEVEASNSNLSNANNDFSGDIDGKIDLYNAIDNLKGAHKTVVILKYFNDLPEKEISQVMQIPINTVKSHLRRAKSELKKLLK